MCWCSCFSGVVGFVSNGWCVVSRLVVLLCRLFS